MPTTLTPAALREIETLLSTSRRELADIYREWRAGLTPQTMAETRNHHDLKRVKNNLSALRILFGLQTLPGKGSGRQQALYEASFFLRSDSYLSAEVQQHFENLLLRGERTNARRADGYEPLLPPEHRSVYAQARAGQQQGDEAGIYVLTGSFAVDIPNDDLLVKIGWSNAVWDRISGAQTWAPQALTVLRIFPCANANVVEAKMHICLDTLGLSYEGGGGKEWFLCSLELIDSLASALNLTNELDSKNVKGV